MNKKVEAIVKKLKDTKKINASKLNSTRGVEIMKKFNYSGRLKSSSGKEVIKRINSGKIIPSKDDILGIVDNGKLDSTSANEIIKKSRANSDKSDPLSDEEISEPVNSRGKFNFHGEEIPRKADSSKAKNSTNRAYHRQQYRKVWEQLPEFSGWLEAVPKNPLRAFCKVCDKNLHAHRLTLLKHTASIKHTKQAQQYFEEKQLLEAKKSDKTPVEEKKGEAVELPDTGENGKDKLDNNTNSIDNLLQVDFNESISEEPDSGDQVTSMILDENNVTEDLVSPPPLVIPPPPHPTVIAKPPISTHVLDTSKGLPVPGLPISLYKLVDGRWTYINEAYTNPDGRCADLIARDDLEPGRFKLHFDTDKYYELRKNDRLFPFIEIVFDLRSPTEHVHIPLLMTPFGYTTYKGS